MGSQFGPQINLTLEHVAAYQSDYLLNGLVNIQRRLFRRSLVQEIANPLNHFARAHAIADHTCNNFAQLIKIWRLARKKAHTHMAVGDYRTEWLIDLMGYRGYQFPHGHHSRDVRH